MPTSIGAVAPGPNDHVISFSPRFEPDGPRAAAPFRVYLPAKDPQNPQRETYWILVGRSLQALGAPEGVDWSDPAGDDGDASGKLQAELSEARNQVAILAAKLAEAERDRDSKARAMEDARRRLGEERERWAKQREAYDSLLREADERIRSARTVTEYAASKLTKVLEDLTLAESKTSGGPPDLP